MRRITIPDKRRKNGPDVWHIEAPGCIINVRPYLRNAVGERVTSIEILPDAGYLLDGRVNNRIMLKRGKHEA